MFFINHTDISGGDAAIIEIDGPLNSDTTPDFDDYICKLEENNIINLLIDMKNIRFISSEGIGATLMVQKSISRKNGLAVFFNVNYEISSLFRLLGFDRVFTIAYDRAEALQILDRHMELFPSPEQTGDDHIPETEMENEPEPEQLHSDELVFFDENETGTEDISAQPRESAQTAEPAGSDDSFEPFVIECVKCRSLIRIRESGDQLCPYCSAEFTVSDEKKAVFKVRDIQS